MPNVLKMNLIFYASWHVTRKVALSSLVINNSHSLLTGSVTKVFANIYAVSETNLFFPFFVVVEHFPNSCLLQTRGFVIISTNPSPTEAVVIIWQPWRSSWELIHSLPRVRIYWIVQPRRQSLRFPLGFGGCVQAKQWPAILSSKIHL